jgi:molecular chaperone GrpE
VAKKKKNKKEDTMQHDGQEQQESRQQPTAEQNEQQEELQPAPDSAQSEQQLTTEQQAQVYLDLLQRTKADFVNYRRRMGQEQAENRITAQSALLSNLLPILDDLRRALDATPPELSTHPWVQGLFLVARRLSSQLDQLGVRQIGVPGEPFDPHRHEAIIAEERTDQPEGTILHVAQPGYVLGERVIRPAQVSVASPPSSISETPAQQKDSEF